MIHQMDQSFITSIGCSVGFLMAIPYSFVQPTPPALSQDILLEFPFRFTPNFEGGHNNKVTSSVNETSEPRKEFIAVRTVNQLKT